MTQERLNRLNELMMNIYSYNYGVEESPLGDPWVRVCSHPCVMSPGDPFHVQEFDADELEMALEHYLYTAACLGNLCPEDFLGNLEKIIKNAGPVQEDYRDFPT